MEREEVVRIAREKLGASGRFATGEYTMLARLLQPGERIEAMLLGKPADAWLLASGVVVVATDRRLLLVSKAMVSRRERVEEIPREELRGARLESPLHIVFELRDGERGISLAMPPSQLAGMVAYASGRRSRFDELEEVVRRKLGRIIGAAQEFSLILLDGQLQEDEAVLDVAWASRSPEVLVVVCPERLVLVPDQPLRALRPPQEIRYAALLGVEADDGALILRTRDGERRLEEIVPIEAAEIVAGRVAARLSSGAGA